MATRSHYIPQVNFSACFGKNSTPKVLRDPNRHWATHSPDDKMLYNLNVGTLTTDHKDSKLIMIIESAKVGKAVVLKLTGRMDADSNKEFDAACERLEQAGSVFLVVDLSELHYINSAGLGSFLRNAKRAQGKGGALLLCGLKGLVKEVFEITRLITVFPVFDCTDAACQSIA